MASVVGVLPENREQMKGQLTQAGIEIINERLSDDGTQVLIWVSASDADVVRALEAHGADGFNRIEGSPLDLGIVHDKTLD